VNWQHLRTFIWLRWRLLINQWRKAGTVNAVLMIILTVCALATAIPLFIGSFVFGLYAIPKAAPAHLMLAWDALAVVFLFIWCAGLVTELQRSDSLSLSKFMHLPVSATGAFVINYLSSLFRLSLVIFGPIMLAFCLALVVTKGIWLVLTFALLAAFLLMVTALTYQLQGWLASLMSNPRRRRTVVMVITATFVLIFQLPNLLNFYKPWRAQDGPSGAASLTEEIAKLNRDAQSEKLDSAELDRRLNEISKNNQLAREQADRATFERLERTARLVNTIVPIGWLPLGVMSVAEGRLLPAMLGLLGMSTIGTISLWRAYRTTIGIYQGQSTARKVQTPLAVAKPSSGRKPQSALLETRLPRVSEPVSAVALGSFRSLMRSPEAKMMLLTPLIAGAVFGSLLWNGRHVIPISLRPLIGVAAMAVVLLGLTQMMANQFGFDRDGFRVFVLCAASRRDILLGKNLAFAPLGLGMATVLLLVVQTVCPMKPEHVLAMIPQYVMMFVLFCFLMNLLSIYAPIYIAPGSLKPSNPKLLTALMQAAMIMFIFPMTQGLSLFPLGIEALARQFDWLPHVPICLVLTLIECAAVVVIYRLLLDWQGSLLQSREQLILETVTNKGG
jgi:ABC-2 type transport system permease protein